MSKKDDRIDLIDQEDTFQPEYFYAVKDIFQSCKTPVAEQNPNSALEISQVDVSDHLHTVYPGRRCARYLTGATDQPALHVFTLVQMSSSASSPPSPAPPATLQDCRQAARQRGGTAGREFHFALQLHRGRPVMHSRQD